MTFKNLSEFVAAQGRCAGALRDHIAAFATAVGAAYGNLHFLDGLLIGVPAVGGVMIGTWCQQRLATRSITLLFAAVLVAAAVELLLE